MLRDKLEEAYTIVDVTDMLVKIGGMSRATLFSTSFRVSGDLKVFLRP